VTSRIRGVSGWVAAVVLAAVCVLAPAQAAVMAPARSSALQIIDDRGAQVRLKHVPKRIISLLPSLTETVCDLGACDRLVGVDRWSSWPASVQGLPRLGGLDDPQIERIVSLRPDLVLVAPSTRVAPRLRSLGLSVAELDAQDLDQVRSVMSRLAILLGQPERGAARWQALQQGIDAVARQPRPAGMPAERVYFEVSSTPYAAGEASFIGELLRRLGAGNVVPAALGPFPKLNPEFIVRADPTVIILPAGEAAALAQRPGWSRIQALRQRRVCALSPAQVDVLARPGPRLVEGVRVLADCLRPLGSRP